MMPESELLRRIGPELKLLVWLAEAPLSEASPEFESLNYLLDGLARQHILELGESHLVNFVHQQFGKTFYLSYINQNQVKPSEAIEQLKALLKTDQPVKWSWWSVSGLPAHWQKSLEGQLGKSC